MAAFRSVLVTACAVAALAAADVPTPARYRDGMLPKLPTEALGGGQVFVELAVSDSGAVDRVTPLRTTPPFTEPMIEAIRDWRFLPAEEVIDPDTGRQRVRSTVLVAGVFRAPVLVNAPVAGEPPTDVAAASDDTPFPLAPVAPPFPSRALAGGIVLVEVQVSAAGAVTDARLLRSAPPFDGPALDAARRWTFRPARLHGRPTATLAYILFGFREPVVESLPKPHERLSLGVTSRGAGDGAGNHEGRRRGAAADEVGNEGVPRASAGNPTVRPYNGPERVKRRGLGPLELQLRGRLLEGQPWRNNSVPRNSS